MTINAKKFLARIKALEAENKDLRRKVTKLSDEVRHLGGGFVGSKKRHVFHRRDCKWAGYFKAGKFIEFMSHQDAIDAGYKPCKTCCA